MGNRQICAILLLALLASDSSYAQEAKKPTRRIGDLVVTLVGIEDRGPERGNGDHYGVAIRLRAENIGKQALCISFAAIVKATFGLQYRGSSYGEQRFEISELLPAESTEGEYLFSLKNGTQPLQLILKPPSRSQTCSRGKDSLSATWHQAAELRFDLPLVSNPAQRNTAAPLPEGPESPKVRVFLTGDKGGAAKPNAVKAFSDHCPQVLITTNTEAANYFVELVPAGLRHNKNSVTVTNKAGGVLHDGTTMNLGNAAKDACVAILKDLGSGAGNSTPP